MTRRGRPPGTPTSHDREPVPLVQTAIGPMCSLMESSQNYPLAQLPVVYEPPDEERFFKKLRRVLGRVPFGEDLLAAWYCALDRNTPGYVRGVLFGAVAYFVLPADIIPDVLAGLGFTDDASVIAAAIAAVSRHISPEHRQIARRTLDRLAG